jgi:hypothetical protein
MLIGSSQNVHLGHIFSATARQPPKSAWRDMPERLARAVQQFADDIGRLHTPLAVLVALQNVSHCTLGVGVLGAWVLPRYFRDQITDWREGENLFFHPDVPRSYWPEYLKQYAEHGYSALTLKARRTSVPFTFAEAERDGSGSQASWIFGFFRAITCATVSIAPIARGQSSSFRLGYWPCA